MLDTFDLTGDGVDDLVIPTLYANGYAGGAYVVPGSTSGWSGSQNLSSAGFYFAGSYPDTNGAGRGGRSDGWIRACFTGETSISPLYAGFSESQRNPIRISAVRGKVVE